MMNVISGLTSHTYEGATVRTSTDSTGNPLFVARDVFECLDIKWSGGDSLGFLDEDESVTTGVIDSLKRTQQTILLTESGLYATIFQSRKPEAKRFRKWVTNEVLPAIRKQGYYAMAGERERGVIAKLELQLRAAKLRAEAQALDLLARGYTAPVAELPEGYATIGDWIVEHNLVTAGRTRTQVSAMLTSRMRGRNLPCMTQKIRHSQPNQGFYHRKLWPIPALEQAARDAGLLPALGEKGGA